MEKKELKLAEVLLKKMLIDNDLMKWIVWEDEAEDALMHVRSFSKEQFIEVYGRTYSRPNELRQELDCIAILALTGV